MFPDGPLQCNNTTKVRHWSSLLLNVCLCVCVCGGEGGGAQCKSQLEHRVVLQGSGLSSRGRGSSVRLDGIESLLPVPQTPL